MTSWIAKSDQPNYIYLSKHDEVLTGRKHTAQGDEYIVDDSEYADNTTAKYISREALEKYETLLYLVFIFKIHFYVLSMCKNFQKCQVQIFRSQNETNLVIDG